MKVKNKIGALVVLGGIALIGLYWFKKNKPTIASSQAKGLQALSNYYQTGSGGYEETFIEGSKPYIAPRQENFLISTQQQQAIYDNLEQWSKGIGQNIDFSNLSLAGITFNTPNNANKK